MNNPKIYEILYQLLINRLSGYYVNHSHVYIYIYIKPTKSPHPICFHCEQFSRLSDRRAQRNGSSNIGPQEGSKFFLGNPEGFSPVEEECADASAPTLMQARPTNGAKGGVLAGESAAQQTLCHCFHLVRLGHGEKPVWCLRRVPAGGD